MDAQSVNQKTMFFYRNQTILHSKGRQRSFTLIELAALAILQTAYRVVFTIFWTPLPRLAGAHFYRVCLLGMGAKFMVSMSGWLSFYLSTRISQKPHGRNLPNFVHVDCGRDSVLVWRRRDTLCTSGFVDDVRWYVVDPTAHHRYFQAARA